jgi:hypothetical protein
MPRSNRRLRGPSGLIVAIWIALAVSAVSLAQASITIENGSPAAVTCQILARNASTGRDVTIAQGQSETVVTETSLDCQYRSDGRPTRYSLQSGRRYRFVNSPTGRLELRSVSTAAPGANVPAARPSAAGQVRTGKAEIVPEPARHWAHVRELTVVIAGGKEYRSYHRNNWQQRARGIVEAAAARFEQRFPIHFTVVGFRDWDYKKAPQTAGDAFEWLHKVDRGDADLTIGFTMVPFPGPRGEIRGVSQYFSQNVVIPDCWGVTGATTRLVHELCHVFGAFHVVATDSVMQLGFERTPKTFRFGEPTEQTIELAKDVNLKVGVDSLSSETQDKIRELYRVHHHPLEGVDEDPIVAGYRYQARRAGWVGDTARSERMQAIADRMAPPAETPSPDSENLPTEKPRR